MDTPTTNETKPDSNGELEVSVRAPFDFRITPAKGEMKPENNGLMPEKMSREQFGEMGNFLMGKHLIVARPFILGPDCGTTFFYVQIVAPHQHSR